MNRAGTSTSAVPIDWLHCARKSWDVFSTSAEQSPLEPQTSNIFSRSLRLEYFNIHTSALFCPETGPIFADMAQEPATEKKPKSFEALTPELSSWILDFAQSSGFARTTPVQAMAIPLLMGNKDLVVEVSAIRHCCMVLC